MEVFDELKIIPNLSLALGFFDGIHIGHQNVIKNAVESARNYHTKSAVITFKEHPSVYLENKKFRYILSRSDKYKYFESLGVDYLFELDFDQICGMSPKQYIKDILVKYFTPCTISTGFNHHFGKNKSGDIAVLSDSQSNFGYVYIATPNKTIYGNVVSSTLIRSYISSGDLEMVEETLGRKFSISGKVIKGKQLGRTIGFPTANILYPLDVVLLPHGVFKAQVILNDGSCYDAIVNFGTSPTVSDDNNEVLEAHLLNFSGNLYDQNIRVEISSMIRPEVKFDSLDSLKAQIILDILSMQSI